MEDTVGNLLTFGKEMLQDFSDTPELDTEVLLSTVLKVDRPFLYAQSERNVSLDHLHCFKKFIERRKAGEPIAYIVGHKEFWSLDLSVTPDVLIPRPETELLVELTLSLFASTAAIKVVDLGVGSGAIAIALAKERPNWSIYGTEISGSSFQVAAKNAEKYQLKNLALKQVNHWYDDFPQQFFDAIVSNPPYIKADDPYLQDLKYEPTQALVGGCDGLSELKIIIENAQTYLKENGWFLVEHGFDQKDDVMQLFSDAGFRNVADFKDLAGHPRVMRGQK